MKNKSILFGILTGILVLPLSIQATGLDEALRNGWVSAVFSTVKDEQSGSTYHGKTLRIELQNLRSQKTDIHLDHGRFFHPADTNVQRMMVVEEMIISLAPNQKVAVPVAAFCSQMHKASPSTDGTFAIGKRATGSLLKLTEKLSKHKIFDYGAQNAIWCLTDGNDLFSIVCDKAEHTEMLRSLVSEATGQLMQRKIEKPAGAVTEVNTRDSVNVANREGGRMTMVFEDETGTALYTFFKDKYYAPSSKHTIRYTIQYTGLPVGRYYVKLSRENRLVYLKEILVSQAD